MICRTCPIELTIENAYKYRGSFRGWCKTCWRERYTKPATKRYRRAHVELVRASKLATAHRTNFGGQREYVIQRDGEHCVHCGMTREEHKTRFGFDITVDHIDRKGHGVPKSEKNNDPSNLQTLCISCHLSKDAGIFNRSKSHCPQGHPYNTVNTYISRKGSRICRTCVNAATRRYRHNQRALLVSALGNKRIEEK